MNQDQQNEKQRKDEIITTIYITGVLQKKIDKICFQNFVSRDTNIHADVEQEVFYQLSKMNTTKFLDWYDRNPNNIEGLAVTIAKRAFMVHPSYPDNPNHSLVKKILHTSGYNNLQQMNVTDVFEEGNQDYKYVTIFEGDVLENNEDTHMEAIYKHLDLEEQRIMNSYMDNDGKERSICSDLGISTKEYRHRRTELFNKIKTIKY